MKAIMFKLVRDNASPTFTGGTLSLAVVSPAMSDSPYIFTSKEEMQKELQAVPTYKLLSYTLEPQKPQGYVYHKNMLKPACIPPGLYKLESSWSQKFRGVRWYLVCVPYFTGIMLHSGNFPSDTKGCILVGENRMQNGNLINSSLADNRIRRMMNRYSKTGAELYIKIV